MTAHSDYERLEASGLWREAPDVQRREVIVSLGNATLTITDLKEQPLSHWSLTAVDRLNPSGFPAIYAPDGDHGETLELAQDESVMISAIDELRRAIDRTRPHPGRLRLISVLATVAAVLALLLFWLPGAMQRHALQVVPEVTRHAIGTELVAGIERVSGQKCSTPEAQRVLAQLARRTGAAELVVLPAGPRDALLLPGGIVALNKALIEDYEDPAVTAGYILAELQRGTAADPLGDLLDMAGPVATFRLLTTGNLARGSLESYGEHLVVAPRPAPEDEALLAAFAQAELPSSPYAYARDITGETVLTLIEADPTAGQHPAPVLADRDWVILQGICGG